MHDVSLGQIEQWTGACVRAALDRSTRVPGVSTDTRTLAAGELFVALKGDVFDGHRFVEQAFARGACGAVVAREWVGEDSRDRGGPLLAVESPLEGLGAIACGYRQRFAIPVVAVVGSSGKTTTKEMIAAVLGRRWRVLKTTGNENNEIGLPKTLLQLGPEHGAAVLEMAARKMGDIAYLCGIARPTIGVLLNIGTAHLEYFGSVERVAKAKGELLDYLGDESSLALVNVDDCVIAKEAMRTKGRLLGFSLDRESRLCGEGLVLDQEGRGHFSLQNYRFDLQIPGRHNVYNALAAAGVGHALEVPWEDIQRALNSFQPIAMRSEFLRKNGICVINDSYNANPGSMQAALQLLADVDAAGGRRIAVLGDMLELGEHSAEFHAEVGRRAAALGIDVVLATGPLSVHAVAGARAGGLHEGRALHFADKQTLGDHLSSVLADGDVVLVKASRGMELEAVVARLSHG